MRFGTAFTAVAAAVASLEFAGLGLAGVITLTNADNNKVLNVKVGDNVEVRLTAYREKNVRWSYTRPVSTDTHVLVAKNHALKPNGGARGNFHAAEPGTAQIKSEESCTSMGAPCSDINKLWKVTVKID
ncbi:hypothetical protein GQ42DRAFT_42990 [Ramicandelaber brevisporus]|nr:hypothetical protein GQ42DRAFT_42990 [Ramicandelaber brevisporus]